MSRARGAGIAVADSEEAGRPYNYYKPAVFVNAALRYACEVTRRPEGGASDGAGVGVGTGVGMGVGVAVGTGVGVGVGAGAAAACFWYASQAGRWLKSRRRRP